MMRTLACQLAAGAVLVASSCGPAAAPPTPVPSRPPALTHLTVAYSNISATIMPLWVAKQTGLFEKHGLDLDLQYAASATSVAAVVSGQMQLATVGLSEVLGAIAGGAARVFWPPQVPAYPSFLGVARGTKRAADRRGK